MKNISKVQQNNLTEKSGNWDRKQKKKAIDSPSPRLLNTDQSCQFQPGAVSISSKSYLKTNERLSESKFKIKRKIKYFTPSSFDLNLQEG